MTGDAYTTANTGLHREIRDWRGRRRRRLGDRWCRGGCVDVSIVLSVEDSLRPSTGTVAVLASGQR